MMKAAWYERQGAALEVLRVGEMEEPQPQPGEVRIRMAFSGVNPGDVKKREDAFGVSMPYPRVIPHSDGSGTVDAAGEGVPPEWIGRRVWCYGAQSYRPFGTAAEYTVVPVKQVAQVAWERCKAGQLILALTSGLLVRCNYCCGEVCPGCTGAFSFCRPLFPHTKLCPYNLNRATRP